MRTAPIFCPPTAREISLIKKSGNIGQRPNQSKNIDGNNKFFARLAIGDAFMHPQFFLVGSPQIFSIVSNPEAYTAETAKLYARAKNFIDQRHFPADLLEKGINDFYVKNLSGFRGLNMVHAVFQGNVPQLKFLSISEDAGHLHEEILKSLSGDPPDYQKIWENILSLTMMEQSRRSLVGGQSLFGYVEQTIPYTHWIDQSAYETRHFMVPLFDGKGEIYDWVHLSAYGKVGRTEDQANFCGGGKELEINESFYTLVKDNLGMVPDKYQHYGRFLHPKLKLAAQRFSDMFGYFGPVDIDLVHCISDEDVLSTSYFMEAQVRKLATADDLTEFEVLDPAWRERIFKLF